MAILLFGIASDDDDPISNNKRFHLITGLICPCIGVVARHLIIVDCFKPSDISRGFSKKLGGSILFSTKKNRLKKNM